MRRALCIACIVAAVCCGAAWAAPPASEYQVKAAYLFNFGQFVEWPLQSYATPSAPFVIGILGEDPFGLILDQVIAGESLSGHPLIIKRFKTPAEITDCNILFIGRGEAAHLAETLKALQGRSILTVTDIAGAERQGAIISLVNENNHVRMRINVAAARESNLVISSKLLRPAEIIGNEGK